MKPHFHSALVFLSSVTLAWGAEVSPSPAPVDYRQQPAPKFEYGLVRVWNAKGEPVEGAGHVPEARLGDSIVVELKNIDQWLCLNLDAGAWTTDPEVLSADPLVARIVEDRKLWPALQGGRWLEMMMNADDSPEAEKQGPAAEEKNVKLLAALPVATGLEASLLPATDETGAPLDPANPKEASRIVEACRKALLFVRELRKSKATQLILSINKIQLPGLPVDLQEPKTSWRSASDRKTEGDYTWWRIKLRALDNPESDKAWSELMRAAGSRFSVESKLSLSLPNELVALPTSVTPEEEDSRCRFALIAIRAAPRAEKKLAKGDAVYPLDVRERMNEVRKAEVVEVDESQSEATRYVVHFVQTGGTKTYRSQDLARLPPDPLPMGVVRLWNETERDPEWEEAQKDEMPTAKIGDSLVVEVRNFDGWLCNQVDQGFLRDDPLLQKVSKGLDALIKAKGFSTAVKIGGAVYRIGHKKQKTSADIVRQLQREAPGDPDLAALPLPKLQPPPVPKVGGVDKPQSTPVSDALNPEEEKARKDDEKRAQDFLAPYREAHTLLRDLVKAKLRGLDLTINDLALGVTPDSSDFTPIYESRRPAQAPGEDTYHWLKFALAPKANAPAREGEKAQEPFQLLLSKPSFTMPSKVTLTLKSGAETLALPTAVTPQAKDQRCRFGLIGIDQRLFTGTMIVFGLIVIALCFFAARTDLLRDPCRRRPEGVEPVSLARTQMAFWFVVIAAAFLFLWVTTGNISTINTTCLVLLAIGTTTALSADAISKRNNRQKDLSDVLGKTPHDMLGMTPTELDEAIGAKKKELQEAPFGAIPPEELEQNLKILNRHEKEIDCFLKKRPKWLHLMIYSWWYRLRTVFEDLLTEEAGTYDFHRFQMLAWTLVLGAVFVWKVFYDRVMPVFDANVLLLMGISSGAYLGFKKVATGRAEEREKAENKPADAEASPRPAGG